MRISDWSSDVCSSDLSGARYAVRCGCDQGCGGVGMMDETPETECRQSDGQGFIRTNEWPFGQTCPACNGMGYRPMTEDEEDDAAEEQHRIMRSEEHTTELQSLMRRSYAGFCLKKKQKEAQKT